LEKAEFREATAGDAGLFSYLPHIFVASDKDAFIYLRCCTDNRIRKPARQHVPMKQDLVTSLFKDFGN